MTYERFLDAIISARAEDVEVKKGDNISLGALSITVLHPIDNTGDDLNNQSVVLHLEYGQASFLFTGDAEREAESNLLASELKLRADVLKVGHHGSRTSSTASFLAQVKPLYAVYSAGKDNQ
jgi:competence protein ComEC